MSKIDKIDNLNTTANKLEEEVGHMQVSLMTMNSTVEAIEIRMEKSNEELKNKLENLERYFRDFNIRLTGVEEEDGEDCMSIILAHLKMLSFVEAFWRIGKGSSHRKKVG